MGTAVLLKNTPTLEWKELFGHYMALTKATSGAPVVHWVGAGWSDSGDFPTPQSWWGYLDQMAQRIDQPLRVTLK
jgi:hypothetical protein